MTDAQRYWLWMREYRAADEPRRRTLRDGVMKVHASACTSPAVTRRWDAFFASLELHERLG